MYISDTIFLGGILESFDNFSVFGVKSPLNPVIVIVGIQVEVVPSWTNFIAPTLLSYGGVDKRQI